MLAKAIPDARHICIADAEYHDELRARGVEPWPLWDTHGRPRRTSFAFDCHARMGSWGEPGARLADHLGTDLVQWLDADVIVHPTAAPALLEPAGDEVFWVPRKVRDLTPVFRFGKNCNTWLGVNCSMQRLRLGSRPDWWERLADQAWIEETESHVCGSDQAAITRLAFEERGWEWREPNQQLFELPHFGGKVVPWTPGLKLKGHVAFFPYEPHKLDGKVSIYTKPWMTENPQLAREYRAYTGTATDEEMRVISRVGLRLSTGQGA